MFIHRGTNAGRLHAKVLAALDVHTGRWIVEKCFKSDLVRGRTIILVVSLHLASSRLRLKSNCILQTHNVALVQPIADFVIALGNDGRIISQGSLEKALHEDGELLEELKVDEEAVKHTDDEIDKAKIDDQAQKDGKLVVAEEIGEGHVGWNACKSSCGKYHPWLQLTYTTSPFVHQQHLEPQMALLDLLFPHPVHDTCRHQCPGTFSAIYPVFFKRLTT